MKKIIFKTLYETLFDIVILAVIYCFFTHKIIIYLSLIDIVLHIILFGLRVWDFKLVKDIKKLEGELFNGKRN